MPSLSTSKRASSIITNGAKTLGQIHKENADWAMEYTWDTDPQSKVCYIYDYFHDDQPRLKDHITYRNTTKTRIDAKFIVKSHQSIDKDQVEYYLQFKPSQPVEFGQNDELYYFETDYRQRYGVEFPIGCYVDIPDDKMVYRKWLICGAEIANQFPKYLILPCTYEMMWIEKNKSDRIKRRMWAVLKNQNSYNSGLWVDRYFHVQENQDKCWLPLNSITERIWYTDANSKNMRVIVSAPTSHPVVWTISKIENAQPLGLQKITLYQTFFDQDRDYIEYEDNDHTKPIVGMWADYYQQNEKLPANKEALGADSENQVISKYTCEIKASTHSIKVGGSYRLLTATVFNDMREDLTDTYSNDEFLWKAYFDDEDVSEKFTWLTQKDFNKIKIKAPNDRSYLNKELTITCTVAEKTLGSLKLLLES